MEESTFRDLDNAVLEILDRQVGGNSSSIRERNDAAAQIRARAGEVTQTLKVCRLTLEDQRV